MVCESVYLCAMCVFSACCFGGLCVHFSSVDLFVFCECLCAFIRLLGVSDCFCVHVNYIFRCLFARTRLLY